MILNPSKKFSRSSTGVTIIAGVAASLIDVVKIKIQKGLGVGIPGRFKMLLGLTATLSDQAEIYFGYMTPDDERRVQPLGSVNYFQPFKDLTLAQQQDKDYEDAIIVDLGIYPILALIEDETFVISVYDPTIVAAAADTEFYVPYYQGKPADVMKELELRQKKYNK